NLAREEGIIISDPLKPFVPIPRKQSRSIGKYGRESSAGYMVSTSHVCRQNAEDFLFEEARFLDECFFEAWLSSLWRMDSIGYRSSRMLTRRHKRPSCMTTAPCSRCVCTICCTSATSPNR